MEIVIKNIKEIKMYENNPRNNDRAIEYVANSIKEFGFKVPIILDKNNVIVAGHTRYKAAKLLNLTKLPCTIIDDLTEDQIKAFRLIDNKSSELASWNVDLLDIELENIKDIDMDLFNFEINNILENIIEDDYEIKLPENPKTKMGDIYRLGNHYLMCGDSTNDSDVKKLMNNHLANLIITDPPYNVNYEGKTNNNLKILNDDMSNEEFYNFLESSFINLFNSIHEGGSIYIYHSDTEGINFRSAMLNSGFKLAQCLIWIKNAFVMGRQDYQWQHEPILYGWKPGAAHYFINDRTRSTILEFDKPIKNEAHPTMKPIEMIAYFINNSSKKNDIVLDLFGGSGSTLIACEQTNRQAFIMELDPKYCDVIVDRWEKFTNRKAELIKEG